MKKPVLIPPAVQVAPQVEGGCFWKNKVAVLALPQRDAEVLRLEGCAEPWQDCGILPVQGWRREVNNVLLGKWLDRGS